MPRLLGGWLSLVGLVAACTGPSACDKNAVPSKPPDPPSPQPGYVGEDDKRERSELVFASASEKQTYDRLHDCLERKGDGFYHYPLRRIGNFVTVEWCKGDGAHINCSGGDTKRTPGAAWSELEVLHHDRDWPKVFGLSFDVGTIPEEGIGASVGYSTGGKGVLGDYIGMHFFEVRGGAIETELWVGMTDSFEVGEEPIEVRAEGTREDLWERLRASPASLRSEIEGRLDVLEKAVDEAFEADLPRKCVYGEYEGDGIPPPCIEQVPLSASEKAEARKRLSERLQTHRAMVAAHGQAMHATVMELLPERCFSP